MTDAYTRKLRITDSLLNIFKMKGRNQSTTTSRLLYEGYIAGYQYHDGHKFEHLLKPGADLSLKHEPENPFDDYAVAVYYKDSKIGFVPQHNNVEIAELLKRGYSLKATVADFKPNTDIWDRVQMQVINEPR